MTVFRKISVLRTRSVRIFLLTGDFKLGAQNRIENKEKL